MRRFFAGLLVLGLGLFVSSNALPYTGTYTAGAGINGTAHDLPRVDTGMNYLPNTLAPDTQARICIYCHAPHNTYKLSPANLGPGVGVGGGVTAGDDFDYLPLWNHELTGNAGFFTPYQNGPGAPTTGDKASQAILDGFTIGSTSLLCLSCHDGSIAVNSYGNADQPLSSQSSGGATIGGQYLIGKDNYLGNHHPIGFDYDVVDAADDEIKPATGTPMGTAGDVREHLYGPGNSRMECGTCHSVHNKGNTGDKSLLWRKDESSRLCLTCHDKGDDPGMTP